MNTVPTYGNNLQDRRPPMLASNFNYSQHLSRQMATLLGMTRVINSSYRLEQQLSLILQEVNRIMNVEHSIFYLLNGQQREIRTHFLIKGSLKQHRQPFGNGIAEYVINSGKVVMVDDVYRDPHFGGQLARIGGATVKSFLIVPILNRNGNISGCLQVINKRDGGFDQKDIQYMMILADLISIAIQTTLVYDDAQECKRLEKEISKAVDIQRQLLPKRVPQLPGYEVFAFNQPSKYVGGDYYDFFPFPRTMSFVLADVSGKGVPAALLTANLHASLHAYAKEINSCAEIVKRINNHFYLYTESDMFATFFWANLNHDTHEFKYVNAGHVPPILVKADGTITRLKSGGLPIGIMDSFEFEEATLRMGRGDMLLIFSDGITEVSNREGQQFGKSELMSAIRTNRNLRARDIGKQLLSRIRAFCEQSSYPDDMTLMIIKRNTD